MGEQGVKLARHGFYCSSVVCYEEMSSRGNDLVNSLIETDVICWLMDLKIHDVT